MRKFSASLVGALACLALAASPSLSPAVPPQQVGGGDAYRPEIKKTTPKQRRAALEAMQIPDGMQKELFAAEPMVVNPVAFCFDAQGRLFVAESFRQSRGVEDNRGHMDWLNEDLAAQTVADRDAYMRKHLADNLDYYTTEHERIRLLEDRDGDGKADKATVFADGFNELVEGTGAGVLCYRGSVYYTCIPRLWRLTDTNGDGRADEQDVLHEGYGVRTAFRGHDLHGLTVGPDGKIYYSIGDRGFNVVTPEGRVKNTETGAVFRCNPDGSELEVFAFGLRNPQELAFDKYGNLFTGDNNSDSGDKARWVHVVEDGDSGWRMAYQYLADRGPWNREKLWHPYHEGQPAYIVPPVANLANGPSGLVYYPGTGLPERYDDHFFLCEFRGGPTNSGVLSFAVEPHGATFKLGEVERTLWSVLATDVDFGPDSRLYISDWINGWNGPGMGRIYAVSDPASQKNPIVAETQKLLAEGMADRPQSELLDLLAHPNMKVRLAAQFELAARGEKSLNALTQLAQTGKHQLARLHAIWGLGQIAESRPEALDSFIALLEDDDLQVRSQAAKLLGDHGRKDAAAALIAHLKDESLRVRFFAAQSLGKLGAPEAVLPLVEMLRENDNRDPMLRHAGVMGLVGTADLSALLAVAEDESDAVRMGVLLALRRKHSPEVARFLDDVQPALVVEAARAIHDLPIPEAMPRLAALVDRAGLTSDALLRRVLNANFRLGGAENALAVARYATRPDAPEAMRLEAVKMLADWTEPAPTDRVLNMWRPLEPRDPQIAKTALRAVLPGIVTATDAVRGAGAKVAAQLGIREIGPALVKLAEDASQPAGRRVEAIDALLSLNDPRLEKVMRAALADAVPEVRAAGRRALAKLHPAEAVDSLQKALKSGETVERQNALATLAALDDPRVDTILAAWLDKLLTGDVAAEIQLDLLEAAAKRKSGDVQKRLAKYEAGRAADAPLAAYRATLQGGDAERGRDIFFHRVRVSCVRCHTIDGRGGEVGPDLSKIGVEKRRDYLLEAIVLPNKSIAKGFSTAMLILDSGKVVSGIVKEETDQALRLITAEGKFVTVAKNEIDERLKGQSPMPADVVKQLSKRDLRDLVEFLSRRK